MTWPLIGAGVVVFVLVVNYVADVVRAGRDMDLPPLVALRWDALDLLVRLRLRDPLAFIDTETGTTGLTNYVDGEGNPVARNRVYRDGRSGLRYRRR